jgi:hypothetical protein
MFNGEPPKGKIEKLLRLLFKKTIKSIEDNARIGYSKDPQKMLKVNRVNKLALPTE